MRCLKEIDEVDSGEICITSPKIKDFGMKSVQQKYIQCTECLALFMKWENEILKKNLNAQKREEFDKGTIIENKNRVAFITSEGTIEIDKKNIWRMIKNERKN